MGREKKRKRSVSNTPPVEWASILAQTSQEAAPAPAPAAAEPQDSLDGVPLASSGQSHSRSGRTSRQSASNDRARGAASEPKGPSEQEAWRTLVLRLAALAGDPEIEQLLADKHPELEFLAEDTGATGKPPKWTIEEAQKACRPWFDRALRGMNRQGPSERTALIVKLSESLKDRTAAILSEATAAGSSAVSLAASALRRGKDQVEGPLVCALLSRELEGSRFEGIWISRSGQGRYILGDDDAVDLPDEDADGERIDRVINVAIKVSDDKLIVDGFFHKGEPDMNPVRCQIGPFLTVYFEGLSLKEALHKWQESMDRRTKGTRFGHPGKVVVTTVGGDPDVGNREEDRQRESLKALAASLPPGWELRESRSKKGVYYYANEAKGISQNERPKA